MWESSHAINTFPGQDWAYDGEENGAEAKLRDNLYLRRRNALFYPEDTPGLIQRDIGSSGTIKPVPKDCRNAAL